jgi:hypothetical protein
MNQIAAPAHITADEPKHTVTFTPLSLLARFINSLSSVVIRKAADNIANRYEGSSWCDKTERDLIYDVMTGCHTERP